MIQNKEDLRRYIACDCESEIRHGGGQLVTCCSILFLASLCLWEEQDGLIRGIKEELEEFILQLLAGH